MNKEVEEVEVILENSEWINNNYNLQYKFINNTIHINRELVGNYSIVFKEESLYLNFPGKEYPIIYIDNYTMTLNDGKVNFEMVKNKNGYL